LITYHWKDKKIVDDQNIAAQGTVTLLLPPKWSDSSNHCAATQQHLDHTRAVLSSRDCGSWILSKLVIFFRGYGNKKNKKKLSLSPYRLLMLTDKHLLFAKPDDRKRTALDYISLEDVVQCRI